MTPTTTASRVSVCRSFRQRRPARYGWSRALDDQPLDADGGSDSYQVAASSGSVVIGTAWSGGPCGWRSAVRRARRRSYGRGRRSCPRREQVEGGVGGGQVVGEPGGAGLGRSRRALLDGAKSVRPAGQTTTSPSSTVPAGSCRAAAARSGKAR